jgi:DNA-binding protein YbaB
MFGTDPDQAEGQISQWAQGFTDKAGQFGAVRAHVEQIQVTESSADGAVRVTIDSSGAPIDLTLTSKISGMPPSEVAAVVTDCMRRAQQQLAGQMRHAMAATVGAEEPLGQDQDDRTEPDPGVLELGALDQGEINDSPPCP